MRLTLFKLLSSILLLASYSVVSVEVTQDQTKKPMQTKYLLHYGTNAPTLDGVLDEPVWQQSTRIELKYQNEPIYNALAPVKTIAYLYQDDSHLHIAIQAFDPNPKNIRANLRKHDNIFTDDNVGIIIDTYNDKRSGFGFFVNPLGAQADMTTKESDDKDEEEDHSWNAIWQSVGKINDEGYVVEMSIPFHVLRFPDTGKELTWNIAVKRNYPRDNLVEIANYQQDHNRKCVICQYKPLVGFKNIKKTQNFQVTPTVTVGRTDIKDLAGANNAQRWQQGKVKKDVGLNVRWGINQNLLLNATLNPDFSQVEADDAQLAINTNDALYYEEKRQFFVDGADYLTTPLFGFVHSRNIADPTYGLKLTGKTNDHLYGVMVADDQQTNILIPSNQGSSLTKVDAKSTALIARYRLDMGKLNNIGVLLTRREADGYYNRLLSIDGSYWINNQTSVNYQLANSDTKNPEQVQQDYDLKALQSGQAYLINLDHRSADFSLFGELNRVDTDFRADLGFQSKVSFQGISLGGSKDWFASEHTWMSAISMNQFKISADWDKSWDLDNRLLEQGTYFSMTFEGAKQSTIELGIKSLNSLYQERYYRENQMTLWLEFTPIADITVSSFMRYGDQIDYSNEQLGTRFKIASHINWQINQNFQLEAEYDYSYLTVDGGELYNADVIDTKLIWQFNSRQQLRFIMQYTKLEKNPELYLYDDSINKHEEYLTTQLLYSYTINPQTLFYIGYADNGFEDDTQQFIRTDRTVFTKFSYAF